MQAASLLMSSIGVCWSPHLDQTPLPPAPGLKGRHPGLQIGHHILDRLGAPARSAHKAHSTAGRHDMVGSTAQRCADSRQGSDAALGCLNWQVSAPEGYDHLRLVPAQHRVRVCGVVPNSLCELKGARGSSSKKVTAHISVTRGAEGGMRRPSTPGVPATTLAPAFSTPRLQQQQHQEHDRGLCHPTHQNGRQRTGAGPCGRSHKGW